MDIYCRVTEAGLVPLYDSDMDEKRRLKIGSDVLCKVSKPRNYKFHKKFMALVRLTLDNLPEWMHDSHGIHNMDDMLRAIKLDLGVSTVKVISGREHIVEGSISFAAMDETMFERFFKQAVDLVLHTYLIGTDNRALLDEIDRFK